MPNEQIQADLPTPTAAHEAILPARPATASHPQPNGAEAPRTEPKPDYVKQRLVSLDVYRGLIMVTLAFNGFGLAATAVRHLRAEGPSPFWEAVHHQNGEGPSARRRGPRHSGRPCTTSSSTSSGPAAATGT